MDNGSEFNQLSAWELVNSGAGIGSVTVIALTVLRKKKIRQSRTARETARIDNSTFLVFVIWFSPSEGVVVPLTREHSYLIFNNILVRILSH